MRGHQCYMWIGLGWMGWMVIIVNRSSKSTFGVRKEKKKITSVWSGSGWLVVACSCCQWVLAAPDRLGVLGNNNYFWTILNYSSNYYLQHYNHNSPDRLGVLDNNHYFWTILNYSSNYCGFWSNRTLPYFPLSVRSFIRHRRDISTFLDILTVYTMKPYIFWMHII